MPHVFNVFDYLYNSGTTDAVILRNNALWPKYAAEQWYILLLKSHAQLVMEYWERCSYR